MIRVGLQKRVIRFVVGAGAVGSWLGGEGGIGSAICFIGCACG